MISPASTTRNTFRIKALPRRMRGTGPKQPTDQVGRAHRQSQPHSTEPCSANTTIAARLVIRLAILALALASRKP